MREKINKILTPYFYNFITEILKLLKKNVFLSFMRIQEPHKTKLNVVSCIRRNDKSIDFHTFCLVSIRHFRNILIGLKPEKKLLYISTLCILLIISLTPDLTSAPNQNKLRSLSNKAYSFGETLNYKVGYKFITAGTGSFQIMPSPVYRNNRKCYDIRFQVRSLPSLEGLYKVLDRYRTVLDMEGIFPWEFEQNVREGNYKKDYKASFDQNNHTAKVGTKMFDVTPYVHDIVSAFYFVRTLNLHDMKNGSVFYLKNFFDDSTYSLGVKIHRRETIDVEAGKFRCIVIEPLVQKGGLFKNEGNIFIWVTDDDRKIPVKVATKIIIGYVGAELTSYSGNNGPVDSKEE